MNQKSLTADEIINLDETENLDNEKLPPIDETENLTEHNLVTSPWSRIGIIGVPLGIGFLVFYFLFNNIMNGKPTANNPNQNEQKSTQATVQSNDSNGDVYAQLALAKQQEQLDKINQHEEKTPAPTQKPSKGELKPVAKQTQPVQVSSAPPPPRTNLSPATTYSSPQRTYLPPRAYSSPQRNLVAASTPAPDPIAELERLRSLGSFGQVAYANTSAKAGITNLDTQTNTQDLPSQTDDEPPLPTTEDSVEVNNGIEKISPRWSSVKSNVKAKNYLPEENQVLQGKQARYLTVGTFATGEIVTPLVKATNSRTDIRNSSSSTNNNNRSVARLRQDWRDNLGVVAIPAGTLLAIELVSVDGGNYASANVRGFILDNTEYLISAGAISVGGEGGKPLIAQKFQDLGGGIGRNGLFDGAVSALGKVGEIINQPDTEEEWSDDDGRTRRRTSGNRRNLTGALMLGFFGQVSQNMSQRNQRASQEITARPNVYYIPQGTQVTFLVNRTLELELP
ncbi:TrbI/VirB10 family protein [Nostoc favosum]|uniref:Bacterial conjugation TrbI-like protein n=1 Tax=Nostoc favosum CHAB5714 TaxID=2780399 RepID=A0ABS8IA53_9NOSO|nr:TrbI/VirB10 family protein [Nostoc favosum]MCC5600584.1 hypothetical protein [Nostoc favosum CHAB5714]